MKRKIISHKKLVCIFLVVFLLFLFVPCNFTFVSAEGESAEESASEELGETIEDLLSVLDTEELQEYLETLSQFQGISVKEKLLEIINGEFFSDYSSLGESVLNFIWEGAQSLLPAFSLILAVALLCGILNSTKSGFLNSNMSDIINFVGYLSVGAVLLSCLIDVLSDGFTTISSLQTQMEIIFPILLTLMAASGGTVSVTVYQPAVVFFSGAIVELFTSIILPLSVVVIVLGFLSNLSQDVKTDKLGDFFKNVNKWLIGFSLAIFAVLLSVQGLTASSFDGISLRALKYVISGSVPLVGGFLSGSVDFILAGSALIKNALGTFAIFLILQTLLKPLLMLVLFQLFLKLSAAATEPVGGKFSDLFSRISGDLGYFIAGLISIVFLYYLIVLLLVCSTGASFA